MLVIFKFISYLLSCVWSSSLSPSRKQYFRKEPIHFGDSALKRPLSVVPPMFYLVKPIGIPSLCSSWELLVVVQLSERPLAITRPHLTMFLLLRLLPRFPNRKIMSFPIANRYGNSGDPSMSHWKSGHQGPVWSLAPLIVDQILDELV